MNLENNPKVKIRVRNLTKQFELLTTRSQKIRNLLSFSKQNQNFWALRGVSFDVYDGEAVAVIGLNGSGKSTLSNIVSEIYPPTTGTLEINGESSIIAIGSGLKNQLTGRDNIHLKLLMNGLKNSEIKALMPKIIDFSELGDFINQPVKTYSSGMKSKLGFAIMAHTNPDVMLIDEALSVGDATFANKSFAKIKEFKAQGKTIFFVSHSMGQLRQIADRVIWMHFGEIKMMGRADEVLPRYEKWLSEFNSLTDEQREFYNLQMKETQRKFSLEAYIKAEAMADLSRIPLPASRLEKATREQEKRELERKMQQQFMTNKQKLKQKRFGYLNWLVASGLILVVLFTSLTVVASDLNHYNQKSLDQTKDKKTTIKRYVSSKKSDSVSEDNSEASTVDTDGDGIPDDQDATPNGDVVVDQSVVDSDGDGIPDDQDATPNGDVVVDQSVVDSDGDGIPDDQDTTPNGLATEVPSGVTGSEASTGNSQETSVSDSDMSVDSQTSTGGTQ